MESCIRKSIEQYRRIIEHAGRLEQLLQKADPDQLQDYTSQLYQLQEEAGLHDRIYQELWGRNAEEWKEHPLVQERTGLLEKIVELNHLLLPRIRSMMAVTAHELAQIKDGRTAVAGYQQSDVKHRRFVRGVG